MGQTAQAVYEAPEERGEAVRLLDQEADDEGAEDDALEIGDLPAVEAVPRIVPDRCESRIGVSTMNAAPRKLPDRLPRPPTMMMNIAWNERSRSKLRASTVPR